MRSVLRSLLSQAIDYAGIFPPAKLDIPTSVENYLRYKHGPESWILGRFVCSTGKLPELARELAEHPEEPFIPVAVIAQTSTDRHSWEVALGHDANGMNRFIEAAENHAEIETYEIRVPDHEHLESFAADLHGFTDADVFVELPWSAGMNDSLSFIAETEWLAAKARTGGTESAAFPSSEALAGFLQQCVHLDLKFKLTAGLHHPFPMIDKQIGARMHGFVNVMTASILLASRDLSLREAQAILDEDDPAAFQITETGIGWGGHTANFEDVQDVRNLLVSFGSCSVEDPLNDLERAGLLRGMAAK